MIRIRLDSQRLNPLSVLSGAFLVASPFGAWMTLSAFGYTSGSTLLDIMRSQTSFPIGESLPSTALFSSLLLIISGVVMLKKAKIGVFLSSAAVGFFGLESYSTFGFFPSAIPVSILPGIGFFLGICGLVLGLCSLRTGALPLASYLSSLRTGEGIGQVGIVAMSIFLAADGWSHWSNGELSGFLGVGLLEGVIHRVFFLGVASLLMVFLVQRSFFLNRTSGLLVLATFTALVIDAVYHYVTGSIVVFIGHDATEILLHGLTYYGAVSLIVARFLLKR